MQFFGGAVVALCVFYAAECSIFDLVEVFDDYDENLGILIGNSQGTIPLEIVFNTNEVVNNEGSFQNCSNENKFCQKYVNETYLIVSKWKEECVTVNYSSNNPISLKANIDTEGIHLYGGPQHNKAEWPVDKVNFDKNSYVTKLEFSQAILEPYWLISNGYYIYVDNAVPLFITQNSTARIFELIAANKSPYVKNNRLALNFAICKLENVRAAQEHAIEHFLGKPQTVPDVHLHIVKQPIWSTWIKYKWNELNGPNLRSYAEQIASHGYGGQIEIDGNWENCYGSLVPDEHKFHDLKGLVVQLKKLNFTVSIRINPIVKNVCQPTYYEAVNRGFFVKNRNGETETGWWDYNVGYIDFTNPQARDWFRTRLLHLRQVYGFDSFKFNDGESGFAPQPAIYHEMSDDHPETNVKAFVNLISSLGLNVHTNVARGTQQYPVFVRTMPFHSQWISNSGLTTIIPTLLQMNILGYSFVLPDMIGGSMNTPAKAELYIRWLQLYVFLPSMYFSVPPWDHDNEVMNVSKKFVDLHIKYSDKIIELMKNNVKTGAPVNPPIWWIAPDDPTALECDSEFLLGEDILVAPVLVEKATSRDIYLPKGSWKDGNADEEVVYKGPIWLRDYKADLHVLPYFLRMTLTNQNATEFGHDSSNYFVEINN